ncbi:MAG: branched-chain amino acid ABC transporter permease, partial [Haloarcula sp.]
MAVSDVVISFIVLVAIYGILSYGLTLKYGHTGLLDFGHVGFFLVGAYTSVLFVLPPDDPGDFTAYVIGLGDVPIVGTWVVGIAVATVLSGIIGGLVALPTIRLREDYLAITVLGVSVIFQRFIQAESWFANGPDALRGYSPPLKSSFPLLLDGQVALPFLGVSLPATPVLFGVITAVVWGVALAVLAGERNRDSPLPVSTLYLVGSFGLSALSRPDGPLANQMQVAAAGGVVAAALMAALLAVADLILLVGVLVSAFTWLVLVAVLARQFGRLSRREWLSGIALGTGFLVALLPIPFADAVSVKIAGSLLLLGLVVGGFYRGVQSLDWFAEAKVQIVGAGALWFVAIWYFVI